MASDKLKIFLIYGLLGFGLVYNINCAPSENGTNSYNTPPEIITISLGDAVAGEYYEKQIDTYDKDGDSLTFKLINAPDCMVLENNIIKWSPRHPVVGLNGSQVWEFYIGLSVSDGKDTTSKYLKLGLLANNTDLAYLRTDENIRFVCEYPCITSTGTEVKDDSLDELTKGLFDSIKLLKIRLKSDVQQNAKPVDYHIMVDSLCHGGVYTTFTPERRRLICDIRQFDNEGIIIPSGKDVTNLIDIKNFGRSIHEYIHGIFNNNPLYTGGGFTFQEHFCNAISNTLTEGNGYFPGLNSFCDSRYEPSGYYTYTPILPHYLCTNFGFDVNNLPALFKEIKKSETDTSVKNAKCILDTISQTNTYNAFNDTNIYTANTYYNPPINGRRLFPEIIVDDFYCGN